MNFTNEFRLTTEIDKEEEPKRLEVSNDIYCIGIMIEKLITKIEHTRLSLNG